MTYATISEAPGTALPAAGLSDELFEALLAAVEVAAPEPAEVGAPVTTGVDAAPSWEWTPPVDAPWRGGTLDTVTQLADMCGGVVSDGLLPEQDRTRVFARRLARAGRLRGSSYIDGRFVAAAPESTDA